MAPDRQLYHKVELGQVLLAAGSGALLFLAFPRPALYPLAWVALVPLLVAIRRARPAASVLLGLVSGFVFFSVLLYWVAIFGYAPWLLLAVAEGLSVAVFALLASFAYRRGRFDVLLIPSLWTAIEWVRSLGSYGFTWGGLAYSQAPWPDIIQLASITGPWGVTFLIVFVNAALAGLVSRRDRRSLRWTAAAGAMVYAAWLGGVLSQAIWAARVSDMPAEKVAMVQGGIEMTWRSSGLAERIYQTYWPMTETITGKPDFIVWPESALPDDIETSPVLREEMSSLARRMGAYMLVGGMHEVPDERAPGGRREYNGAYLISPSGRITGAYYKVHLVPFGEFVPGRRWIPFLDRYPILDADRYPGPGYNTLHTQHGDIGVAICFESIFPQIARRLARDGAQMLFIITNDSWFKRTAAAAQHHEFAVFRAVENRRYVARNATTGITSLITPLGRVTGTADLGARQVVSGLVRMIPNRTLYTRYGDWFAGLCAAFGLIGLLFCFILPYTPTGHPR